MTTVAAPQHTPRAPTGVAPLRERAAHGRRRRRSETRQWRPSAGTLLVRVVLVCSCDVRTASLQHGARAQVRNSRRSMPSSKQVRPIAFAPPDKSAVGVNDNTSTSIAIIGRTYTTIFMSLYSYIHSVIVSQLLCSGALRGQRQAPRQSTAKTRRCAAHEAAA